MRLRRFAVLLVAVALGACASTEPPLPPPVDVLLVVDSLDASLRIIPVEAPSAVVTVPLSDPGAAPTTVAARGAVALVPLRSRNAVDVIDLRTRTVSRTIPLPAGSLPVGAALVSDSIGYVANTNLNTVTRVNVLTGDTASVAVGTTPQWITFTRGRVFVVNGNRDPVCAAPGGCFGESWITIVQPSTNQRTDSVPLTGPGNARFAAVGPDGLLYVVVSGHTDVPEGRLSVVDPAVAPAEISSVPNLGQSPGGIASSGLRHLVISEYGIGLLLYDIGSSPPMLVRGPADPAFDLATASGVEVDADGRIYALERGACDGASVGAARVLRPDFTQARTIALGHCPVGAAVASIPAE